MITSNWTGIKKTDVRESQNLFVRFEDVEPKGQIPLRTVTIKEAESALTLAEDTLELLNKPLEIKRCERSRSSYTASTEEADIEIHDVYSSTGLHTRSVKVDWKHPEKKDVELELASYCPPLLRAGGIMAPISPNLEYLVKLFQEVVNKFSPYWLVEPVWPELPDWQSEEPEQDFR